jgi:hypothetical protein
VLQVPADLQDLPVRSDHKAHKDQLAQQDREQQVLVDHKAHKDHKDLPAQTVQQVLVDHKDHKDHRDLPALLAQQVQVA